MPPLTTSARLAAFLKWSGAEMNITVGLRDVRMVFREVILRFQRSDALGCDRWLAAAFSMGFRHAAASSRDFLFVRAAAASCRVLLRMSAYVSHL